MCSLQNICCLFLGFSALILTINGQCAQDCSITMRCDPYVNDLSVWTVVDGRCKGYKSGCLFDFDNCKRGSQCLSEMTPITHQQCEPFCPSAAECDCEPANAICGYHPYRDALNQRAHDLKDFYNQCHMDRYACLNLKPFLYKNDGLC